MPCVKVLNVEIVGFVFFVSYSSRRRRKIFFMFIFFAILLKKNINYSKAKLVFIYRVVLGNFPVCRHYFETYRGKIVNSDPNFHGDRVKI